MEATAAAISPMDKKKAEIMDKIKRVVPERGLCKFDSCPTHGWDALEHAALQWFHRNGIEGYHISYTINWGVHDWVVVEA